MKRVQLRTVPQFLRVNYYILFVIGYVAILIFNYLRFGLLFQYSLGYYALFAIPVIIFVMHRQGKSQEFLRKWVPFLVILMSYEALQGIVGSMVAQGDLFHVGPIDEMLWGFNLTGAVQQQFLSSTVTSITLFLYSLHFPLIVVASVFLWFARRSLFNKYAIAMVLTSYVALVIFALMPSAPPWFDGFAKNLVSAASSTSYAGTYPGSSLVAGYIHITSLIEADKFAAFPSLHAAYMVLFAYFITRYKPVLAAITLPLTFGVFFATLYLGQHYLIDLIAGTTLALTSAVIAELAISRSSKQKPLQVVKVPNASSGVPPSPLV
jgi:membrane-associated phospholipid phosphatase